MTNVLQFAKFRSLLITLKMNARNFYNVRFTVKVSFGHFCQQQKTKTFEVYCGVDLIITHHSRSSMKTKAFMLHPCKI